jgi:hypothetical protein
MASAFVFEFNSDNIISLKRSISGRPKPHCIIGRGVGDQVYSKCDFSHKGIWLFEEYEVENGFADDNGLLEQKVDAEWSIRQLSISSATIYAGLMFRMSHYLS